MVYLSSLMAFFYGKRNMRLSNISQYYDGIRSFGLVSSHGHAGFPRGVSLLDSGFAIDVFGEAVNDT